MALTHPTAATPVGASRHHWMDLLRGASLLVVIFDHAIVLSLKVVGELPDTMTFATRLLEPIRMPAMVFLSGLLLRASLDKGRREYVTGKLRRVLHPYVVWSVIYVGLFVAAGRFTGTPHHWTEALEIAWAPPGQLWLLHHLFLYYVLALALRRLPRPPLVLAAFALAALGGLVHVDLQRFWYLFGFFLLADHLAGDRRSQWEAALRHRAVVALAGVAALALVVLAALDWTARYEPGWTPVVVAAVLGLVVLARRVGAAPGTAVVRYVGRHSLVVYVVHWMAITVAVQALRLVPGLPGAAFVLLAFAAAVVGSLIAAWLSSRSKLVDALFVWPWAAQVRAPHDTTTPVRRAAA